MENTQEKLYPKVLTQSDFDTWITDYLSRGWYLFFINPNTKAPFATQAFELSDETERRLRELEEETNDPTLNKEARAKARREQQKYGKGLLDATNDIGDRQYPAPGTLRWLYWKALQAEKRTNPKTKKVYPVCPQIACATGPSGLFVLDVDVKEDFKEHFSEAPSFKALEALEEANGELPDHLLIATTPRGGQHMYFKGAAPSSASKIGPGIDVRSEGGYIILSPSICAVWGKNKKGKKQWSHNGQYQWLDEHGGIPEVPDWLLALAKGKGKKHTGKSTPKKAKVDPRAPSASCENKRPPHLEYDVDKIIKAAHTGAMIEEGTRNDMLFRLACKLRGHGFGFEEEEITELLEIMNEQFCHPKYDEVAMSDLAERACQHDQGYRPWLKAGETVSDEEKERHARIASLTDEQQQALQENYNMSDTGNIDAFIKLYGPSTRYTDELGFLHWNDTYWELDNGEESQAYAKVRAVGEFFERNYPLRFSDEKLKKAWMQWGKSIGNAQRLQAMLKYIRKEPRIHVAVTIFENKPYLLNVKNGTLDLRDGTLGAYRQADYLTQVLPWTYDPEAPCPMWQRFLQLVTHEDQTLMDYLQRVAGYALTGDTGAQVFFYLYGRGGTGKSTFLLTLLKLVGGYGMTTDIKTFAFGSDSPKELAKMPGKRYIYGGDVQKNTKLDIGLIKRFTGSDFVTGRDLYKKSFEFQPQGKLFFGSNFELRVDATDDAFFRRVQMIPFNVLLPKKDYQGLFADELEGIFAWAVQGAMQWYADGKGLHGLAVPQAVTNAVTAYQEDMDYMKEFMEDCLVDDPEGFITSHDLFKRYEEWCYKEKVKSDKNAITLSKELKKRGYKIDRKSIDGEQQRGIFGLSLLPDTGHDTFLRDMGFFERNSNSDL